MRRLAMVAAVVATSLIGAAPAVAKHAPEESFTVGDAAILGPVHVRGSIAQVHARYSCDIGTHIWVSVKQSASGAAEPQVAEEGAGFEEKAAVWWQSHRNSFTCDGKRHVAWFTVDTVEPGSRGQLKSGFGWVQFCITTEEDLSAIRMQWSQVVTN